MIRSIRSIGSTSSVWIPGLRGPAEPFDGRKCFPSDPAFWGVVRRHYERAIRWDLGPGPVSADFIDEAIQAAICKLLSTTPAEWARMKIGYGDLYRAIMAIRSYGRRAGWIFGKGRRKKERKIRPYPQSGKNGLPGPVAVAMAIESATAGVEGRLVGSRHTTTNTLTADDARASLIGYSREAKLSTVSVRGGEATINTPGIMREIPTREVSRRVEIDGVEYVETETTYEWRMIPGRTKVHFEPGTVYDSAEW